MFISTIETVPGMNYQILGVVQGNTVQSKDFVSDFKQGFKSIVGGELNDYTEMMNTARGVALDRMVNQAMQMGADGVIGIRYTTSSILQQSSEILAYGTAIKFVY